MLQSAVRRLHAHLLVWDVIARLECHGSSTRPEVGAHSSTVSAPCIRRRPVISDLFSGYRQDRHRWAISGRRPHRPDGVAVRRLTVFVSAVLPGVFAAWNFRSKFTERRARLGRRPPEIKGLPECAAPARAVARSARTRCLCARAFDAVFEQRVHVFFVEQSIARDAGSCRPPARHGSARRAAARWRRTASASARKPTLSTTPIRRLRIETVLRSGR